jgi:MFS family permease
VAVHPDTHEKHAHPALFGLLLLPFGLVVGYSDSALSLLFQQRGASTELIGVVVAIVGLGHSWKFLWAPVLDAGSKRKNWFMGSVLMGAACVALATVILPSRFDTSQQLSTLEIFTALVAIAEAAIATSSAAIDALMAITLPNEKKGAAAGWSMAGNVAGTSIGGSLIVWLFKHVESRSVVALVLAAIIIACGIPGAFLRERQPVRHPPLQLVGKLVNDVWATLKSREGWTGLVICLTPVGTGSALKLMGALSAHYLPEATRDDTFEMLNAIGGFLGGAGSLLGGYLADHVNRRVLYVFAGVATAFSAIAMAVGPATTTTFAIGSIAYSFFNGVCYAAFAAFVLEMIGHGPGVASKYQLFVGASNFAISYVAALDGFGEKWGEQLLPGSTKAKQIGVLGTDALATFVGCAVLALVLVYLRRRPVAPMPVTTLPVDA